jgi:hypothetical protein
MKRFIGVLGSLLVIAGVFLPAAHIPLVGGIPLFLNGGGIGAVILCGATVALALYALNWSEAGNVVGLMTATPVFLTMVRLAEGMANLGLAGVQDMFGGSVNSEASAKAGGLVSQAIMSGAGLSYAWIVLLPGAIMISLAAFVPQKFGDKVEKR